ncbi:hypothetical protein KCP75_14480 [Salmonella enterica subsp. enterica]|nr:hypothetical protein KCP75_14480 [Salmonella enterica subsp. enterica]
MKWCSFSGDKIRVLAAFSEKIVCRASLPISLPLEEQSATVADYCGALRRQPKSQDADYQWWWTPSRSSRKTRVARSARLFIRHDRPAALLDYVSLCY